MKNTICFLAAVFIILFFAGCATTSDSGDAGQNETPVLSWNDASSKSSATPESPAPYSAEAPETPKNLVKKGLDDLFDGTRHWPQNTASIPVTMNPAADTQYWDTFKVMVTGGSDIDEIEDYLLSWYGIYGWTPEFYAACHNFYFQKATVLLETATSEDDIQVVYENLDRCFASCFHGSMQYPERLDLWCGYIHAANMLGDYDNAESCIQAIFDRLEYNGNNWYWTYNEPFYGDDQEAHEREFVQIMHDYVIEFMNAGFFDYSAYVSERLLTFFPENVIALNDAALTYLYAGELETARPYLERANAADPEDLIVLTNLAYVCEDLGDYDAALEYANMMIMSGEEDYVDRGIKLCAELNQLMYPDK
ncbi:MAG: tetratricopeptide repeat protein [Treponema sp.]|nr:tetratricopeptide repeat protein [Candidatus Treponema caballi]